jgi:hypothetical protein
MSTQSASTVIDPINYKIQIKRVIVNEFRNYFQNVSDSVTINKINCALEYPNTAESYPAVIVGYKEKEIHNAGISHLEDFGSLSQERWFFTGDIKIEIMALTNLERDYISDHVVSLYSFGSFRGLTFESDIFGSSSADIQVNLKTLTPIEEQTMSGATWGLTDSRIYTCGYTFPVLGSFISYPLYEQYITGVNTRTTSLGLYNETLPAQVNNIGLIN